MFKNKFIHRNKFCQLLDQWQTPVPGVKYCTLALTTLKNVTYKHGVHARFCISSSGSLWLYIGAVLFLFLFFNQISCLLKVDFLSFRSTEAHKSSLQILLSIRNTASKVVYKEL